MSSFAGRMHSIVGSSGAVQSKVTPRSPEASLQDIEDAALMARLQEGDIEALAALYDRYHAVILRVGLRLLRDSTEAEDLLQEVFLYLFRRNRTFDISRGCVGSWLIQVTYSRALDRRKWLKRRSFEAQQNFCETMPAEPAASGPDPEELAELSSWRPYLMQAFDSLNERQRETIRLYIFEGYSLLEISQRMGESLPNVRHYYYRGLKQLRNRLSADGFPIRREV